MGAVVVLVWVACAALGYVVGRNKGRGTAGLLLGLLLGIIGLIIIACLKPKAPAASAGYPLAGPHMTPQTPPLPQGWGYTPPPPVMPSSYRAPDPGPQWLPDPSNRNQLRWWNGQAWTEHVSNSAQTSVDPISNGS
jgi:Protein of unknown function (DUF2510)